MLKNTTCILNPVRNAHTRLSITKGPIFTSTRLFCTYRPTRLTNTFTHQCTLQTPPLLINRGNTYISPLLYPSVRYYSSGGDLEKTEGGGYASTLKRWEAKGKKVLKHYWLGTKLLYTNVGITFQLVKSLINGHTLSRRERKLLVQTSADIFRLIPFIIIVIIPFMELALPILLKLFPNLLPSTYEWKDKQEEDRTKRLRANVEMAKFLQETMGELSLDLKKSNAINADEFIEFMKKVKRGEKVTNKEILTFSRLFEDELTLDKISREQLVAMHNYLHGNSFQAIKWLSTDYLRTRISNKIEKIKQDDILIQKEGVDTLTLDELVDASLVRGMKVAGLDKKEIAQQLRSWLDLSLNQSVPPALLILSRAFMMSRSEPATEALEDTLAHIPQEALESVVRELPADQVERTQERLEELEKERAIIKDKKKEEAKVEEVQKEPNFTVKLDEEAEIKEIKQLDTAVETLKQQSGKILEEIVQAKNEPEAKSPQVLAKKLVGMLQGLEQEIDKIEKEKEQQKEKEEKDERSEDVKEKLELVKDEKKVITEVKENSGETKGDKEKQGELKEKADSTTKDLQGKAKP